MQCLKKILRVFLTLVLVLVLLVGSGLAYLSASEYRPDPLEPAASIPATNPYSLDLDNSPSLTVTSYNIGYGGLGEKQDFFMDGGKMVRPDSPDDVKSNMEGIVDELKHLPSDFYFIQEVDERSKRSYHFNEVRFLADQLNMGSAFTYNFKVAYVPYPIPTIGDVASGLLTLSNYELQQPVRVALPVPFSWPVRMANLKRCLLVTRVPVLHEGKKQNELVMVNLHLEAYDDGEGKVAQTQALRRFMEEEYQKGNYVVAGGDWNQELPGMPKTEVQDPGYWHPSPVAADSFARGWRFGVDGKNHTNRLNNRPLAGNYDRGQFYSLDGFLVSPNVQIEKVAAVPTRFVYSDHLPVQMTFRLQALEEKK